MRGLVRPFEACPLAEVGLRGVSAGTHETLAEHGLKTVGDLLCFLPRDYADYRTAHGINEAPLAQRLVLKGRILQKLVSKTRTGIETVEVLLDDGGGTLRAVWFNQPWVDGVVNKGQTVSLYGKIRFEKLGRTMNNPRLEVESQTKPEKGIEPIYRQVGGIRSEQILRWVLELLRAYPEKPSQNSELPPRHQAFLTLHRPPTLEDLDAIRSRQHPALKRLIFDEFVAFQRKMLARAAKRLSHDHPRIEATEAALDSFLRNLPFQLTPSQKEVVESLRKRLAEGLRLHGLVQGDVGCGKTVVGLALVHLFAQAGLQSVLLCPTTLLASQHAKTAEKLLAPLGHRGVLLSGTQSSADIRQGLQALADGSAHYAVGTHRLLQEDVAFSNLGLVLIDEQHRFGVDQRASLLKKGRFPHYVAFSATPIPRSLAMTVHADFEVYQIKQKPGGRSPVQTILKKASKRDEILDFVRYRLSRKEGVFWVFPLIDDGDEERERLFRSAESTVRHFQELGFKGVGLVHGRMSKDDIQAQMDAFASGSLEILVATTVIEVGVDVPHASVMVIEEADRFGLSQLHQLRGRVGRGNKEGFCFLVASDRLTQKGLARLKVLHATDDGFEIAEHDLAQRGAGDLLGKQQSGFKGFLFGDPWLDRDLMAEARRHALAETQYNEGDSC